MKHFLILLTALFINVIAPHASMAVDIKNNNSISGTENSNTNKINAPVSETAVNTVPKNEQDLNTKSITFNFPNTDIKNFARFVAKMCGKSLVGEGLLKGNINIKSNKKMNLQQIMGVFKTLLNSKALDYNETDIYIEIIPMSDSVVHVYNLKYLKAADVAKSLTQIYRMSFSTGNQPQNIQITSVDGANALMVLAPPNQQHEIEKSIKKLDIRTRQVMLDIMVVELTKTDVFGFGINFNYDNGLTSTGITSGGTPPMTFTTSNVPAAGSYSFSKDSWTLDIEAVEKKSNVKILSQPRAIALENQKTEVKIGEKQAYISGTTSLGGTSTGSTQSTDTNDIGLDIELTPRINKEKNVILDMKFKLTNVSGNYEYNSGDSGSETTNIPIVGHRIVNNTSTVKTGETLVIGGLLKNKKTTTTIAPPVLGDIPFIGWALSKDSELSEQVELIIFITPSVIENVEDIKMVTKMEADKLRDFDTEDTDTINQMLTGKKGLTDDVFNLYDYFNDKQYRKEQDFIKQP